MGRGPLPPLAGGTPILALDMYEHSYHMDFGAKAASDVDTFMNAVSWGNADRLVNEVTGSFGSG
jgi:Fe-Mn family superoxide dismutase